jgi:tetratricopeptide (TPR) repeat protein
MQVDTFITLPDPSQAASVDDLVERLRLLKIWAGDPSYETIKNRINTAWAEAGRPASEWTRRSTVANCFTPGRRRLNTDLILAVVQTLHPDTGYVTQWRQALRVIGGEVEAVAQVRVQDALPQDLTGFTGRVAELDLLRRAGQAGDAVVISAIEGMAGVGKTQLAVHAGHLLLRENAFDQVLYVNLRGFHPDPTQPPADPAAVLDGFLRLLGLRGQQIPHDLPGRAAAYRTRLTGTRALIVLDDAATAEQVRPLLPATPGCLALITSRRTLTELQPGTRLTVDLFAPDEAVAFLTRAIPAMQVGTDPDAVARLARRCGYLPLALSLIAGHIRDTPGWTLTDHADRLDERHHERRLDTGVELALSLSYQHLHTDQQRLFRLAALLPGQDFDAHAAAALAGSDLATARSWLDHLGADHLLLPAGPGRYTFHDLVRAYAADRANDEDRPAERRAAQTRLFDYYLAATAAAMGTLHPADANSRAQAPPAATPVPDLTTADAALAWLHTERPTLLAVAAYTASHGWPSHTTRLARIWSIYLRAGYYTDALALHGHAHEAARLSGDLAGQGHALIGAGFADVRLGRPQPAAARFARALELFRQAGDLAGQAMALHHLGIAADRVGRYHDAIEHEEQALVLTRQAGDEAGEATMLNTLASLMEQLGRFPEAIEHCHQALSLSRRTGNRTNEGRALNVLGEVEARMGQYEAARDHMHQAMGLYRQLGNRTSEGGALSGLGTLCIMAGLPDEADGYYQQALTRFRELGNQYGETAALNGLGEAANGTGRPADAIDHHLAAQAVAATTGDTPETARAHAGIGRARHTLGDLRQAREHYQQALAIYTDLGLAEGDLIRARLAELDAEGDDAAGR